MDKITLNDLPKLTAQHFIDDAVFQKKMDENIQNIHIRLDNVATKEDVAEIMLFMKRINTGAGVLRFGWNNASKIGTVVLLLFAVGVFIKFGIMGLIAWFLPKP